MKKVAIVGASTNTDRYAYKAFRRLQEKGYEVVPVHPVLDEIEGVPVSSSLKEISEDIFAVTLYVRPETGEKYIDQIIQLGPKKVIMNPGTESDEIEKRCLAEGIYVQRACTLVLLASDQFELM